MMEGEAAEVSEEEVLEAIKAAHEKIKEIINIQQSLAKDNSKPKLVVQHEELDENKKNEIKNFAANKIKEIISIKLIFYFSFLPYLL